MLGRIDYAKDFTTSLLKAYSGKILVGIGASISASYLAHYFRIENNFKYLFDDDPRKIGLIAPGTNTPVRDLKEVGNTENSLAIILSWQHTEILLTRLREERFTGNVLVPLPFPYIFNL
jgi:hypothetical protein